MIVYSTLLHTAEELTQERFLRNVLAQAETNQLNRLLTDFPETGIKKYYPEVSSKKLTIATDKERGITAVKSVKADPVGYTISREYVLDEKFQTLSLQTFIRNYVDEAVLPLKIKQTVPKSLYRLIEAGLISADNGFPVNTEPLFLNTENASSLSDVINGSTSTRLPIVCITPSIIGRYPVSIEKAAHKLIGLAHVVVPENRKALYSIKENGIEPNTCRGSVWILYPNQHHFSEVVFTAKKDERLGQLLQTVLAYNVENLIANTPSFSQVYDTVLEKMVIRSEEACRQAQVAQKLAELKHTQLLQHLDEETQRLNEAAMEKALQDAEQIVSSYEEDIDTLRNELYEKNLFFQGLEVENQRLRSHLDKGKIPVIYFGQEKEFYLGEIQDLLLSTLEDALEDIPEKSRKRDVITDILNSNNYRHITKERNEQLKHLLKGYDGMSAKVRHGLEELGFLVEETNKHCKISYHGDNRYLVVFGSTPSDVRSGKNNAATLIRMAY